MLMILYLSTVMALERRDTLINDGNVCMNMYAYCYNLLGVSLHVVLLPPFFFFSLFRIICAPFRRQLVSNFQGNLKVFSNSQSICRLLSCFES